MLKVYKIVPMWRVLKNREVRSFLDDKVNVTDKVKVLDDLTGADAEVLPFNDIEGVRVSIEGTLMRIHPDPGCECTQPDHPWDAPWNQPADGGISLYGSDG